MLRRLLTVFALSLAAVPVLAQPAPAPPAGGLDDWGAFNALEKQLKDQNAAPQVVIDSYRKLFEGRPTWIPLIAIKLSVNISEAYKKLGNLDKSLEIDDWAIKKYNDDNAIVWTIEHRAGALNALKRYDETIKLIDDNWNSIVRGGQSQEEWLAMYASTALRDAVEACDAADQNDKAIALMIKALNAMPSLLDDKEQGMSDWKDGWIYDALIPKLLKANRAADALGYAKLHYVTGSFDKDSIARATTSLGRVWGDQEEYQKIRVFAQLQEPNPDAALKNPLLDVKLPEFDAKLFKEHLARTSIAVQPTAALNRSKAKEQISLLLVKGDYATAMALARRLMKDDPSKPDGTLQICRVFKAADLSVRRANQFLDFLEGKAENPVPGFLKEQEAKPVATP